MPTEMKLIYNVQRENFKAEYDYDLVFTNDDIKTANHIADEWFEEIKIFYWIICIKTTVYKE